MGVCSMKVVIYDAIVALRITDQRVRSGCQTVKVVDYATQGRFTYNGSKMTEGCLTGTAQSNESRRLPVAQREAMRTTGVN